MKVTLIVKNRLVDDVMAHINLWDIDNAGEEIETQIMNESKIINLFAVANTSLAVITSISYIFPNAYDEEMILVFRIYQEVFSGQSVFFSTFHRLTYCMLCFIMTAYPYIVIYITQHVKFQLYMFNKYIKELMDDYDGAEERLICTEGYQKEIEFRLKFLIERHNEFIRWRNETLKLTANLIIPFIICGCLVSMSLVVFVIEFSDDLRNMFWRLSTFTVVGFTSNASLVLAGQAYETESEKILLTLMMLKWYNLNHKNKKNLFIFMTNSMEPLKIQFIEIFGINHPMGVFMCRIVYMTLSLFWSIRQRIS
ncbi:hypothetical protein BDFB_005188 [Asbolus verrucosus]|uniref:Odorant receptor n=1 Tax=Asbolus verrucosus TaxID=1661398 RepID=A0A482W1U7_ASBVE|nr:hypothetical protein BDFB_005188 [Asbolus verrucosus]